MSAIATTGVTITVTRFYPRSVAGAFFTSVSIFLIVGGIAGLGTNVGLTYFIARLRSLGQENKIPGIMRTAIIPVVVASLVATGALLLAAQPIANAILSGRGTGGGVTTAGVANSLRELSFMLLFAGLLNAYLGASRGYGEMRPTAWVGQIALTGARVVGVALAAFAGSTVLIAPLWALPYLPCAVLAYLWGRRIGRDHSRPYVPLPDVPPEVAALLSLATPVSPSRGQKPVVYRTQQTRPVPAGRAARRRMAESENAERGFWRFTTPRAIANTAQNIIQQIAIVLVAGMQGPIQAAIYTAATRFLVLGQLGAMAINRASQTRFTELFTLGDRKGANKIYQVTTAWFVLLLWPLYLMTVIFGAEVMKVFGRNYQAGNLVIVILGLTMLLSTACGQVDMVLITSGRSSWSLINGLLTMTVNIGVDVLLIPKYGITGASIGWAVAIALSNVMPLIQLAIVLGLHPFGRGTVIACVMCAVNFGAVPFAIRLALGDGPVGIVAAVIVGGTLQAIALRRFRGILRLPSLARFRRRGGNRRVEDPWN